MVPDLKDRQVIRQACIRSQHHAALWRTLERPAEIYEWQAHKTRFHNPLQNLSAERRYCKVPTDLSQSGIAVLSCNFSMALLEYTPLPKTVCR